MFEHQAISRRGLLRGATCAACLGAFERLAAAPEAPATAPAVRPPPLSHGPLGRTKYPVTRVSFGAIRISDRSGVRVVKAAIDRGVNLIHTSASYAGGNSVRGVAELFKAPGGYRDKVFLCLKSYHPQRESEIDEMLATLGTDHADAVLTEFHEPSRERLDAIRRQQDGLRRKGKVRYTGFVCHGRPIEVMNMVVAQAPAYFDVALIAMAMGGGRPGRRGNRADAGGEAFAGAIKALRACGVGVLSMKSGAKEAVGQGREVFEPHVKSLLEAGADSVLTSINSFQQVEMIAGLDLGSPMSAGERQAAADFRRRRRGACLMCGECRVACPRGLPVNDLMRIRLYLETYGWADHAAAEFASLGVAPERWLACGDCRACATVCPAGLAGSGMVRAMAGRFA